MTIKRDAFSEFEYDGWQRVADRYESTWSGLTKLFIPYLLEAAHIKRGSSVLDVACGPGYVAEAASALGAVPKGVDFSPEMIRLAKIRNPAISFCTGDAQRLDFEDGSFDAVVMNFGVLHLSDPNLAFAEARRVLRLGGHLAFTVWAAPEHSVGARIVGDAVEAHALPNAELPQGPDYFDYGEAETCQRTLSEFGFDLASLVFRTVTGEWEVPTAAFVFEAERDAGVRTAALLAAQTPEVLSAIQSEVESALHPYAKGKGFSIPFAAHVVAARAI
jgi:ubiquinone/menaquinone biosynthesis C-methylase UbiE